MAYADVVLTDAPWGFWQQTETSGPLANTGSGGPSLTVTGAPTFGLAGPDGLNRAILWPSSGVYASSSTNIGTTRSAATVECWFYLSSTPSGPTGLLSCAYGIGDLSRRPLHLWVDETSRIHALWGPDSTTNITISSVTGTVTTGAWHHVVLKVGGGTGKIRLDGVDVASGSMAMNLANTALVYLHTGGDPNNAVGINNSGPVRIAYPAIWWSKLADATTDAHYAAGGPPGVPSMSLSATRRPRTAAFSVAAVVDATLATTRRPRSAAFAMLLPDVAVQAELAATRRPRTAEFELTATPTSARTLALTVVREPRIATFTGRGITPVVPTPSPVGGTPAEAAGRSVVVAKAYGPVTMNGTQPVYAVSKAEIPRARQQIVIDGVDITYFRGVPTPDVDYTLLEPLLYGPGSLELPQVVAWAETFGAGDLHWLRPQAPVEVNLVVDDVVVERDVYKGFIAAFDESGATLSVELGGEANGRAAMRDRQNPIFPRINDVGHQLADAVRDLGLPHNPPLGAVTGIETMTTGGTGHLDHINDLVAKSWTRSGKQWTVMPDPATGVYETHRKDATTIHATAFLDAVHTVGRLRRDIAEEPNQIFVTCVTPAGMRVRFGKYPGLVQGPVPDFPGSMSEGDTGEGVRLLVGKLHASGYLKLKDVAGGFDGDVVEAVRQLQDDAGLPETGVVNLATWRALYDLDVTGLSLEWANIQPAAQRSKTRKFDRSANGTIMGFNDEYDPEVIVRHRTIDLGSGVTRRQAREFARTVLHDSDAPNWVGDITFNTGALIRGEGLVGMTPAPADVMDARELRPGMNLWLPQHDGGTLVHISACQVNGDGIVTATVDTRFRDAMEVWEVIARNKESRNDPSRHRLRRYRASTIVKDSIGEWDEFGGMLGVDLPLERGWNKFPVVAAMEGQIRELILKLKDPAEFAVAVWGKEPDIGWLTEAIPNPLTVSGTKAWETKQDALEDGLLLYSAGTHDEPCGYWPGRKKWRSVTGEESNPDYDPTADENDTGTDDQETVEVTTSESFGTVTGKFVDSAGFPYFAADRKVIWVTIWARSANMLPLGRIMKPQLEAGA